MPQAPMSSIPALGKVGMFLIGAAAMFLGFCTPATAENNQIIYEIPASRVRAMTPDQRERAKAYARQHGIRWRIVEGK
jgi:hypothetical protein